VKLDLLNEATAIDKKGIVWFRTVLKNAHMYWPTCTECKKRANIYWTSYPDCDKVVCDNCREDL
jgi:hypothetical protein